MPSENESTKPLPRLYPELTLEEKEAVLDGFERDCRATEKRKTELSNMKRAEQKKVAHQVAVAQRKREEKDRGSMNEEQEALVADAVNRLSYEGFVARFVLENLKDSWPHLVGELANSITSLQALRLRGRNVTPDLGEALRFVSRYPSLTRGTLGSVLREVDLEGKPYEELSDLALVFVGAVLDGKGGLERLLGEMADWRKPHGGT